MQRSTKEALALDDVANSWQNGLIHDQIHQQHTIASKQ